MTAESVSVSAITEVGAAIKVTESKYPNVVQGSYSLG